MQNVTMLGITIQDRTKDESMSSIARFLKNSALNVIAYIDYAVMRQAVRDEDIRDFLKKAAITEWSESYLAEAVGIHDSERLAEIDRKSFLTEELHSISKRDKTVALAASDQTAIEDLKTSLTAIEPGLNIVHAMVLGENDISSPEDAVNALNCAAPAVVISHMDYHMLTCWLKVTSRMLNTGAWITIPDTMSITVSRKMGAFFTIREFVMGRLLKVWLNRYKEV